MSKRRDHDALMVQVSLSIKLPGNRTVKMSKKALQGIIDLMIAGKPLPRNVTVRGVFWRNPNRHGSAGAWRWHDGADLTAAPTPLEARSREPNWQAAIPSLSTFLDVESLKF